MLSRLSRLQIGVHCSRHVGEQTGGMRNATVLKMVAVDAGGCWLKASQGPCCKKWMAFIVIQKRAGLEKQPATSTRRRKRGSVSLTSLIGLICSRDMATVSVRRVSERARCGGGGPRRYTKQEAKPGRETN